MLLLLDLHAHGYTLAGIFFGLWLLPVGYLGYRSGLLPKVLSVLVVAASVAWIIGTLLESAFPPARRRHRQARCRGRRGVLARRLLLIKGVRTSDRGLLAPAELDA